MEPLYVSIDPDIDAPIAITNTKALILWITCHAEEFESEQWVLDNFFMSVPYCPIFSIHPVSMYYQSYVDVISFRNGELLVVSDEGFTLFSRARHFYANENCKQHEVFDQFIEFLDNDLEFIAQANLTYWIRHIDYQGPIVEIVCYNNNIIIYNAETGKATITRTEVL